MMLAFIIAAQFVLSLGTYVVRAGEQVIVDIVAYNTTTAPLPVDGMDAFVHVDQSRSPSPVIASYDVVSGTPWDTIESYGIWETDGASLYWTIGAENLDEGGVYFEPGRTLLGRMTLDATGVQPGVYALTWTSPLWPDFDDVNALVCLDNVMQGGYSLTLDDGTLTVVPEPRSSFLLGVLAVSYVLARRRVGVHHSQIKD